jgi:hypothetical protein
MGLLRLLTLNHSRLQGTILSCSIYLYLVVHGGNSNKCTCTASHTAQTDVGMFCVLHDASIFSFIQMHGTLLCAYV